MLKAYAVALVMTTSAPVADKKETEVKVLDANKPEVAQLVKWGTGGNSNGGIKL